MSEQTQQQQTPAAIAAEQFPDRMTAEEAARYLRVSVGWIKDHTSGRRRPFVPSVKLGDGPKSKRIYLRAALDKVLAEGEAEARRQLERRQA